MAFLGELMSRQVFTMRDMGLSAEAISEDLGVGVDVVKATLLGGGKLAEEDEITDAEYKSLIARGVTIATMSENETAAAAMIKFLVERKKPTKLPQAPAPIQNNIHLVVQQANNDFKQLLAQYALPSTGSQPATTQTRERDRIPESVAGGTPGVEETGQD